MSESNETDSSSVTSGNSQRDPVDSIHSSSTLQTSNENSCVQRKSADADDNMSDPPSIATNIKVAQSAFTQPEESSGNRDRAEPSEVRETVQSRLGPTSQVTLTSPLPSLVTSLRMSAVTAIKRTRQTLSEKLGRGTKTVDTELETRVESLRVVQKRYSDVMQLARTFSVHFSALISCQQTLAAEFSDLSQKMPELQSEFSYNAETQRALFRNGEILLGALNFFVSSLHTLCFKTINDTLITVKQYEDARLEYDAYRSDMESDVKKSSEFQQSFQQHKQKFEQLRDVLDIKLRFLDENKVKVMHQQLVLFHNAIAAYFAGNQTALEETVKQFNIKLKSPNASLPSWLENQD